MNSSVGLYLILLSALALRLIYIFSSLFPPPVGDAMFYSKMAEAIFMIGILGQRGDKRGMIVRGRLTALPLFAFPIPENKMKVDAKRLERFTLFLKIVYISSFLLCRSFAFPAAHSASEEPL